MSIQAGLLIIAAALIRAAALNRLPKTGFLALWGAALARLLLPFSFSSRWSIYGVLSKAAHGIGANSSAYAGELTAVLNGIRLTQAAPKSAAGQASFALSPFTVVWLAGLFILLAVFSLLYWKSCHKLRFAVPFEEPGTIDRWSCEHPLRRPLRILRSDRITTPLTCGIIRPKIILPRTMDISSGQTLEYVLTHEYFHIRRFDALWKLLALLAAAVHWFNPLVWVMLVLFNRDLELTCDAMVLRHFGGGAEEKRAYACSLISMAEVRGGFSPVNSYFCKNTAEERIISIMKYRKLSIWAVLTATVIVMALTAACVSSGRDEKLREADNAVQAADEAACCTELLDGDGNVLVFQGKTDSEKYTPVKLADTSFAGETVNCTDGVSGPHTEANGHMAIYTNSGGTWALKAGQAVTLTFDVAAAANESNGWSIYLGCGRDGDFEVCQNPRLSSGETALTLTVPEDGDYSFFLANVSAGAIYVNSCQITVD